MGGQRGGTNNEGGQGAAELWPASRPADEIGNKIKNYIKEMSNLIDGGMGLAGEGADGVEDTEEDDDDDENIEDLPSVPETDEESK